MVLLCTLALPGLDAGTQDRVRYIDEEGHHALAVRSWGVDHETNWTLPKPGCLRALFFDLDYAPATLVGNSDAPADVAFEFVVEASNNGSRVEQRITQPVADRYLTTLAENQTETVHLRLATGVDVDWSLQVWGRLDLHTEGCGPEPL